MVTLGHVEIVVLRVIFSLLSPVKRKSWEGLTLMVKGLALSGRNVDIKT
jgi:hypothetical protein